MQIRKCKKRNVPGYQHYQNLHTAESNYSSITQHTYFSRLLRCSSSSSSNNINYWKMTWTQKCNSAEAVCYVRHSILYKRVLSLSLLHASHNNLASSLKKDVDVFNRKTNSRIMNIKNNQEHLKFYKSLLFLTSYYYLSHYNYDRK